MVFGQLDIDESAIWSLLLASGYLKPDAIEYRGELLEPWYHLSITNLETRSMFSAIFKGWFKGAISNYQKYSAFLMLGEKQVKVSRKDFITVLFWDLWLSSQKAMKSVPTGKAGLEDMMQSLLQGAFQRKE
jgi:hypothetical protein